jgi:hypothetical protein
MSYKFNRGCWVESWEETRLRAALHENDEVHGAAPRGKRPDGSPEATMLSIEDKIQMARAVYIQWGRALLEDPGIRGLLQRLERDMAFSHETMHLLGIDSACARCDATAPEGSCCSRGLENKYDVVLLLLNLLMGVNLDDGRSREDSCFFLGPRGCRLRVRSLLCIEYLCPELEEALGWEGLLRIQGATGGELECSFLLCDAIKKQIASEGKS